MIMSPELVREYFDSVGVKNDCPACGQSQWFLDPDIEGPGTGAVQVRADRVDKQNVRSSLLYVLVICRNCGFIRQHARSLIVEWVRARQGGDSRASG